MRALLVVLCAPLAVGCKKTSSAGSGSATASTTGSATHAATAPADAAPAPAADTKLVISHKGVGPITDFKPAPGEGDEPEQQKLAGWLTPLGLEVGFDVMDTGNDTEEGYFSAKKGEQEVLQVFRGDPIVVHVVDPMFKTTDGLAVGDTGAALSAKRPDIACDADPDNPLGALTCRSPGEPDVVFVLEGNGVKKWKKPIDPKRFSARKILEIVR